ncbi:MAG: hypothetical protein HKN16_08240, partial [Saprospiraceae bacterium]|nr:hypothetical protein [Saprospiraceae bacterium]
MMKVFEAIKSGAIKVWGFRNLWALLYMVLVAFAFLMTNPLIHILEDSFGSSQLLKGKAGVFDYNLVADFFNHFGENFDTVIYSAWWFILIYLIVSVFLSAGYVASLQPRVEKYSFPNFVKFGGQYFWKFLVVSVILLVIQGLLSGLAILLFQSIAG